MVGPTEAHAATLSESWLHDTLEQLIAQIRSLLDVTGVAFVTVDADRAAIRPAAAWFATEEASRAFTPLLQRPYDPSRAGVTEVAVESGSAVLIPSVAEWPGAEGLRARLVDHLAAPLAELAWDFYRTASFISCPVRTAGGRTFGVLAISSNPPLRPRAARARRAAGGRSRARPPLRTALDLGQPRSERAHAAAGRIAARSPSTVTNATPVTSSSARI